MRGYIDRFDSTIAGWASDLTNPGMPVQIVVASNGVELWRGIADLFRADLIPAVGHGNHGFSFDPDQIPGFDRDLPITITAEGSSTLLLKQGEWKNQSLVAEGDDGWLFLKNDSNQVNLRIAGKVDTEPQLIEETALMFATRDAMMQKLRIPYCALIVPEKNVVCAKYWKDLEISNNRPALQIIQRASQFGCYVQYPIEQLRVNFEDYYPRTDTHLNGAGYIKIYSRLSEVLPSVFDKNLAPSLVENFAYCGNLGEKLRPQRTEVTVELPFPESNELYLVYNETAPLLESGGTLRGSMVQITNQTKPDGKRLLVFGTSSAYYSLPTFIENCASVLFIWENTFDYNVIFDYKPDCVLWLVTERFLPTSANDLAGLSTTRERWLLRNRSERSQA